MGPQKRAANLPPQMSDIARTVCMSAEEGSIGNVDGVALILRILRERFAPDANDSIFQDAVKLTCFKSARQNTDVFPLEFVLLRQKADARML